MTQQEREKHADEYVEMFRPYTDGGVYSAIVLVNELINQTNTIYNSLVMYDGFDFQTKLEDLQQIKECLTNRLK